MNHNPQQGTTTHKGQCHCWESSFLLSNKLGSWHPLDLQHTLVRWRRVLWLGRRLLSSEDVGLQKRHLVVQRRNFQSSRRLDPKCSTLCQQGSYCILLRFRCAPTKITGSALLLHEVQRVWINVHNWDNKYLHRFCASESFTPTGESNLILTALIF
jgi:hypothetical protein